MLNNNVRKKPKSNKNTKFNECSNYKMIHRTNGTTCVEFQNGDFYQGFMKDGNYHGYGRFQSADKKTSMKVNG